MTVVRWTHEEDAKILQLRDGLNLGWLAIAAELPGRTASACEQHYYGKLRALRNRKPRPRGPVPSSPPVAWRPPKRRGPPVPAAPDKPPGVPDLRLKVSAERKRMAALDGLRERAELQLRIAERGLTGGVFGDPPPGRSALDERRNAIAAPLVPDG